MAVSLQEIPRGSVGKRWEEVEREFGSLWRFFSGGFHPFALRQSGRFKGWGGSGSRVAYCYSSFLLHYVWLWWGVSEVWELLSFGMAWYYSKRRLYVITTGDGSGDSGNILNHGDVAIINSLTLPIAWLGKVRAM